MEHNVLVGSDQQSFPSTPLMRGIQLPSPAYQNKKWHHWSCQTLQMEQDVDSLLCHRVQWSLYCFIITIRNFRLETYVLQVCPNDIDLKLSCSWLDHGANGHISSSKCLGSCIERSSSVGLFETWKHNKYCLHYIFAYIICVHIIVQGLRYLSFA